MNMRYEFEAQLVDFGQCPCAVTCSSIRGKRQYNTKTQTSKQS